MCGLYRPPDAAIFREILCGLSGDWSQTADLNDPESMPGYQALDGTFGMIPH